MTVMHLTGDLHTVYVDGMSVFTGSHQACLQYIALIKS